jgi:glycosyltransferase involved in cell wall biosynthesis
MRTVVVAASYGPNDPPTQNFCRYFSELGWNVVVVMPISFLSADRAKLALFTTYYSRTWKKYRRIASILDAVSWGTAIRKAVRDTRADLFVSFMFHPWVSAGGLGGIKRATCIYDIPLVKHAGPFARLVYRLGWHKLNSLDFVWSSDQFKAAICMESGKLAELPLVCHNVPYRDYFTDIEVSTRDPWLREKLAQQGVTVCSTSRIVLRAGAYGILGGIEETVQALRDSPDWVLVLMGRPDADYERKIRKMAVDLNVSSRVGHIIRPTDTEWKKALLGADLGHLIHLRAQDGLHREMYDTNSSLSNNRLFQYMAAGLPIISYDDIRMSQIHSEIDCFFVADTADLKNAFVRILNQFYATPSRGDTMSKAARNAHLEKYHWEHQFSRVATTLAAL